MSIENQPEETNYEEMEDNKLESLGNQLRLEKLAATENRMRIKNEVEQYNLLPDELRDRWEKANHLPEELQEKITTIYGILADRREARDK